MELSRSVDEALRVGSVQKSEVDSDKAIVARVQEGEVAAFDQLTLKYRERIFSVIYNLTSNREDAADLTQDVFIKAFQSIRRFQGKSSFFTWLYRIAVNTTFTHLRKNRLRRFFSFETIDEELAPAEILDYLSATGDASRAQALSELQEKLNEALQSLSINHRTVIVLFEIESLSHKEIAEIMNCSVGTVRSRLHYAKQQLQAKLQSYLSS